MKYLMMGWILLSPAVIAAAEGKITLLSGEVQITHQKKPLKPKLGMLLKEGDIIETGKNAKVGVLMNDGSSFHIFQNTQLEIRQASTYFESKGVLSANFVRKTDKSAWAIKTPVVTAGVRGTSFTVEATGKDTRIVLFKGKVIVKDFVRETGLPADPNELMQDFLNDVEINSGTALRWNGTDLRQEKIDLKKEAMQSLHEEHQQHLKSVTPLDDKGDWKKAAEKLREEK